MQDDQLPKVEEASAGVTFGLVAVQDCARVPLLHVRLAIAAAAGALVAVVGLGLLPREGGNPDSAPAALSSPPTAAAAVRSLAPPPTVTPRPDPRITEIEPGPYSIPWRGLHVRFTVPAGWTSSPSETAICHANTNGSCLDTNSPSLAVHNVTGVVTDVCIPSASDDQFVEVGPTADDLTAALERVSGLEKVGPTMVMLGGHRATRIVLTFGVGFPCVDSDGHWIWANASGSRFGLLTGGTATIYLVDVDGDRLVIASHYRGASPEDISQLDDIVASIEIEPLPTIVPLSIGRHSLTVDGVSFSFGVPATMADGWAIFGNVSINKSVHGPQGAEGIIYWTRFPDGARADPCPNLLNPSVGPSAADLAAIVATAPGTAPCHGARGCRRGRAAREVRHRHCSRRPWVRSGLLLHLAGREPRGPLWMTTDVGDTISVWIVEVRGTRLFIAGETHEDAGRPRRDV